MQPVRVVALTALLSLTGQAPRVLGVLRTTPESPADPGAEITVTFDRPVAGGLESSLDPDSVFRIAPAVAGRLEWRDPMTLRFQPDAPLQPEAGYTITIVRGLTAMDGSVLERPYSHTFRVAAPAVLDASPGSPHGSKVPAEHLQNSPVFRLLVSAPADGSTLERHASITLSRACGSARIPLRVNAQRPIDDTDPPSFAWRNRVYRRSGSANDLRRVIELSPATPLPYDCGGTISVPASVAEQPDSMITWPVHTLRPLRLVHVNCGYHASCPTGPVVAHFSSPVSGAEVMRHVRVVPEVEFTVHDTADIRTDWALSAPLRPRSYYAVTVSPDLTDVFDQSIDGALTRATQTTGYSSTVAYEYGHLLVERDGLRTLPVQHVNVDTLLVSTLPIPDSMEAEFLAQYWSWGEPWAALRAGTTVTRVPVRTAEDERRVTGVRLPLSSSSDPGRTLHAVRISSPRLDSLNRDFGPIALVQVTDLAVTARIGVDEGMVWVTGVTDGEPRAGAGVTLYDALGRVRATGQTDARGLARLIDYRIYENDPCIDQWCEVEGYIAATHEGDRSLAGLRSYDPDLAPWRFSVSAAWDQQRVPQSSAVFTERGIYRPGEDVIAKAIVRDGTLGSLTSPRGDSIRWIFRDRDGGEELDTVVHVGEFGSGDQRFRLAGDAPLGAYGIEVQRMRDGSWRSVAYTSYQVAEYRPPEFLVDVTADATARFADDTLNATISGRYLFGAPMAHAPVRWTVLERPLSSWELSIPGHDDWRFGVQTGWWDGDGSGSSQRQAGADTLDAGGHLDLSVPLPSPAGGRAANVTLQALVTDANRQVVTAATSVRVHPASFYIGARVRDGQSWFWRAGQPVTVEIIAATPEGERVTGIDVRGTIVRREWHRVRRIRNGQVDEVGSWVSDTTATCDVRVSSISGECTFTPERGGSYTVTFTAKDASGRDATTSFPRWASGPDWVPWYDQTQLKMDVIADRERYAPGDTATLLFASPFTDAEAWITVERERVLESRRMRIEDGATTMRLPITEAYAPNVFVSIVVVKGRTAEPGPLDDPGRPAMRVGYAELRVTPEVKRLAVAVDPEIDEYQPGDTARIALRVTDSGGHGQRAEVTLWAVDLGVLALTGYRTPDPLDLLYAPRGVGLRLASNLVRVAAQVPEGEKGRREAGGGGGGDDGGVLRSRFQTTAFFLGSVVTDANGDAIAEAQLPDNLTTFRVMAVAITDADRFGSGEAEILVTRPLVARPALPRFLREGDRFAAGVLVNHRMGGTPEVEVRAEPDNVRIEGRTNLERELDPGRGREFRFDFLGRPSDDEQSDSAFFRFDARSSREADAVRIGIPYRPAWYPLSSTVAGILRDTASAVISLSDDVDPERSRITLSIGTSPLGFINGAAMDLQLYSYYCSEQVSSVALTAIALMRAARTDTRIDTARASTTTRLAVRTLQRRQTPEGGIGYWSALSWTSPTLSAWSGRLLLEARAVGLDVDSAMLANIAGYLERFLAQAPVLRIPVAWWYSDPGSRLSERLAAADFLSRYGRPDIAAENLLLANAAGLRWEDRLVLAEMLARRGDMRIAAQMVDAAWRDVQVEGRVALLPREAYAQHYFHSRVRPAARLLSATMSVQPDHPEVGALVEALVSHGRAAQTERWNTQDYGWAVLALADYQRRRENLAAAGVQVRIRRQNLLRGQLAGGLARDTTLSLDDLVTVENGTRTVRLELSGDANTPFYWYATVREAPRDLQTTVVDRGMQVERWYERVDDGRPTVEVNEGDVVRVRLRITVPAERHFVILDDPLPAGLEAVDLSLRTLGGLSAFVETDPYTFQETQYDAGWYYGAWDSGFWSPFDHKEMRDDRVVYSATVLWPGTYTATYLARATTPGTFIAPPVHAEEMYNPGVNARTAATRFTVHAQ